MQIIKKNQTMHHLIALQSYTLTTRTLIENLFEIIYINT